MKTKYKIHQEIYFKLNNSILFTYYDNVNEKEIISLMEYRNLQIR